MADRMEPILPGSYLGILGGGQLGRMFTQASQAMGYKVCVLDPGSDSPAGTIAEKFIQADYTDSAALKEMAALCTSVSTEFENVPAKTLDYFEEQGIFVVLNDVPAEYTDFPQQDKAPLDLLIQQMIDSNVFYFRGAAIEDKGVALANIRYVIITSNLS